MGRIVPKRVDGMRKVNPGLPEACLVTLRFVILQIEVNISFAEDHLKDVQNTGRV